MAAGDEPMTHLDLLGTARAVQQAAAVADVDAVHDELCRLRNALVHRVHAVRCDDADRRVQCRLARHGHERLLHHVDELLADTGRNDDGRCTCLVRAAELRVLLVRQARLEQRLPGAP